MRIYIDTNVYLDYFLERKKSDFAFKIFKRTLSCKFQIVLSNHILEELTRLVEYSDITFLFEMLKHKTILVTEDEQDTIKAKLLDTHEADALHIVLAAKGNAEYIVTNNVRDFNSIFKTKRPEEL